MSFNTRLSNVFGSCVFDFVYNAALDILLSIIPHASLLVILSLLLLLLFMFLLLLLLYIQVA